MYSVYIVLPDLQDDFQKTLNNLALLTTTFLLCLGNFGQLFDKIFGKVFDQILGQVFDHVFDQGFGQVLGEGQKP